MRTKQRFKQVCISEAMYNKARERYPGYSFTTILYVLLDRRREVEERKRKL